MKNAMSGDYKSRIPERALNGYRGAIALGDSTMSTTISCDHLAILIAAYEGDHSDKHREVVHGNSGSRDFELTKAAPTSTWPHYSLELTEAHAQATTEALDLYARIGIGQFEVLAEQIAYGVVPVGGVAQSAERVPASPAQCDKIRELCNEMKSVMNFPHSGSNGIGHKHNAAATHAAWEVKKVLDQTMAIKRNPHPDFRGVNYDGLVLRYTDHPAPVATYRK